MKNRVERRTVDLSSYPDLLVIYLGMRVNTLAGLKTLLGFGPRIAKSVEAQPDGLLLHENFVFSLLPPHVGMRQYGAWRPGPGASPTGSGGAISCAIPAGRDSGTRPISCAAGWRLSTTG